MQWNPLGGTGVFRVPNATVMGIHCSTEMEIGLFASQNLPWPRCIHLNSTRKMSVASPLDGQKLLITTVVIYIIYHVKIPFSRNIQKIQRLMRHNAKGFWTALQITPTFRLNTLFDKRKIRYSKDRLGKINENMYYKVILKIVLRNPNILFI